MAKLQENNINKTTATVDRVGLCIVITTVIIILVVVISGICVRFLLEETLSRIILIALICFLCVLGMIVLFYFGVETTKSGKSG
ncbi:hypothetical protein NQ317_014363 [Molorchus minor]|uniref:Uncharacterized protein n=1 Tax=Molorchus minor TaxID=1323400 RepID=A0ABQ9K576_9CUCU|nr:hypothetical protein NQ317_014363 [Molorchus minor]